MSEKNISISEIIRERAAIFIRNEANTNPLITVTRVEVTPNLKSAIIFVTTIPVEREEDALIFLNRHAKHFRNNLKKNTKIKYLPHISFAIDAGERQRQRLDTIINSYRTGGKNNTTTSLSD